MQFITNKVTIITTKLLFLTKCSTIEFIVGIIRSIIAVFGLFVCDFQFGLYSISLVLELGCWFGKLDFGFGLFGRFFGPGLCIFEPFGAFCICLRG